MNYATALPKVEKLHELGKRLQAREGTSGGEYDDFALLYGELEDLIRRLIPDERLEFKGRWGEFMIRNNYIEAGYLSDNGLYQEHGWKQLNQLLEGSAFGVRSGCFPPGSVTFRGGRIDAAIS